MPSELIVFAQFRLQHIAHIDETNRVFRCSLIFIGNCDADLRGIRIGIPKADDVKPGIQCRNKQEADDDNPRGGHGHHTPDIPLQ